MKQALRQRSLEIVTAILFVIAIGMNVSCEKGTEPDRSNCGSGNVTWDAKAGVCRDRADNRVVPNSCCGR